MEETEGLHYYLDFSICKAVGEEDSNGNYTFQVEASNESVDLQDQIVLQSALMKSKDNFLKYGVISYDHLHRKKDENGQVVSDASMIIGEPTEVWTEGKKTFVKGILYKTNDMAREVIKLLKAGSTRIRASVGGLFPKIQRDPLTGIEKITSVLWNDLALTPCPVNNTVSAATFAKSLTVSEFVQKALESGYETDSEKKENGKVLAKEDFENPTINVIPLEDEEENKEKLKEIIKSYIEKDNRREIGSKIEGVNFLLSKGLTRTQARELVQKINFYGGVNMSKGIFTDTVDQLLKSMTKKSEDEDFDFRDDEDDDVDVNINLDDEDDDDNEDEDDIDDKKTMKKGCKKSLKKACKKSEDEDEEDEEIEEEIDATEIIKSLALELKRSNKRTSAIEKSLEDLGGAVIEVAKMVKTQSEITKSLSDSEMPMQSVVNKSYSTKPSGKLTKEDFDKAKDILIKSVADNEITMQKSIAIEHDIQVAMQTGKPMKQEYFDFLKNKFSK